MSSLMAGRRGRICTHLVHAELLGNGRWLSSALFADVQVTRDHRVSSTMAQASISTLAPNGSAEVAKAVRAGNDERKN